MSENSLGLAVLGETLIALSLGSIYHVALVKYGLFLLIGAVVILISYLNTSFTAWVKGKELTYKNHMAGFMGGFILVVFLGIQVSSLPYRNILLLIGFSLIIPAAVDIWRSDGR